MQPDSGFSNGKTILLADDEQFILLAYKDGLEHAGYTVITAMDGDEALEQAKTKPDLILLDLIMPKTNGFDVLKALQADPELSSIPVVVFTNLTQERDEQEARQYGAKDFIIKANVSLNDLVARLEVIL
jgi:CheY-like chemotaxis protein